MFLGFSSWFFIAVPLWSMYERRIKNKNKKNKHSKDITLPAAFCCSQPSPTGFPSFSLSSSSGFPVICILLKRKAPCLQPMLSMWWAQPLTSFLISFSSLHNPDTTSAQFPCCLPGCCSSGLSSPVPTPLFSFCRKKLAVPSVSILAFHVIESCPFSWVSGCPK